MIKLFLFDISHKSETPEQLCVRVICLAPCLGHLCTYCLDHRWELGCPVPALATCPLTFPFLFLWCREVRARRHVAAHTEQCCVTLEAPALCPTMALGMSGLFLRMDEGVHPPVRGKSASGLSVTQGLHLLFTP